MMYKMTPSFLVWTWGEQRWPLLGQEQVRGEARREDGKFDLNVTSLKDYGTSRWRPLG